MESIVKKFIRCMSAPKRAVRLVYVATTPSNYKYDLFNFVNYIKRKLYCSYLERRFSIFISPSVRIERGLVLPHPFGIVFGEGVVIGSNVTIYQHVTIGRKSRFDARYPKIGSYTVLYPGAVIIGPISLGENVRVGANQVIDCDIDDETIVRHRSV